jgi:hypothetical protein
MAATPDPPGYVYGVATDGNGTWVAVGEGGYVVYSEDGGETWTTGTSNTSFDLYAVAVGP